MTTDAMRSAAHPPLGSVLSSQTTKQQQCEKPQLPENRIFPNRTESFPATLKKKFPAFAVKCAPHRSEDGLHYCEVPRP